MKNSKQISTDKYVLPAQLFREIEKDFHHTASWWQKIDTGHKKEKSIKNKKITENQKTLFSYIEAKFVKIIFKFLAEK